MSDDRPIRLALIGAGIFAREVHVPALLKLADAFEIVAIYSRTQTAAAHLASRLPAPVDIYTEMPALLARPDIEAVDIMLPIDVMPAIVELALQAGKHVISEKPMAPDIATGRRLLAVHAGHARQVWLIGENWRYEDAFVKAEEIIKSSQIGRPLLCHWALSNPIMPDNRYYQTGWRQAANFPGGYLLDVGVHHVAALRMLLGEIAEVGAITTLIRPDLPPVDTLNATLQFDNSVVGTYTVTYAAAAPWPPALHVVGDQGALRVHREELQVTRNGTLQTVPVTGRRGVDFELAAFAQAIRDRRPHRNSPQETLQDVAVIEAMLQSAATGQRVAPKRIIGET
jgi:predicted dehydrogenase